MHADFRNKLTLIAHFLDYFFILILNIIVLLLFAKIYHCISLKSVVYRSKNYKNTLKFLCQLTLLTRIAAMKISETGSPTNSLALTTFDTSDTANTTSYSLSKQQQTGDYWTG